VLTNLQVRDFAIVDEIDVGFAAGMTVLTGETGAGKSILVDALGLILGERGGSGLVREGAKRAEFNAEFDIVNRSEVLAWLDEQALDQDQACLVRRVIGADGRSRAFINGNAVTLQSLKTLGEHLADIHGQHFHQSLGRQDVQRALLDHFGASNALANDVADAFAEWQTLQDQLDAISTAGNDRDARLELLDFQLSELEALGIEPGEFDLLSAEQKKLQSVSRLAEGVERTLQATSDADEVNAQSILANASQELRLLTDLDETLGPVAALLDEAGIQLNEAADQLRRYLDSLDADPQRHTWVADRRHAIQNVARKHRVEPGEIAAVQARLQAERLDLQNAGERTESLEKAVTEAGNTYASLARKLTDARSSAAKQFATEVSAAMAGLGMPGGTFEVALETRELDGARAHGLDRIEYLISANPGQPLMPISKVASGGELSRMSLAIQVIASDGSQIPTMVFDEVDSGVGGGVAEMVGRRLFELGLSRQVLCVTHLPQVASQADHHLRITKLTDGESTRTRVTELAEDERIEELARMLGGVKITKRTREHAAEMLASGGKRTA